MHEYSMSHHVCEELVFEIFTRLPPKTLIRFRSLSKSWYSCISSPRFIRMHTSQSPQKFLIRHEIIYKEKKEIEEFYTLHLEDQFPLCPRRGYFDITPNQFPYNKESYIVGSCNGILCLLDYHENRISLWNPSVRRKLDLPDCPQRRSHGLSRFVMGFGFDPNTNDYKTVSTHGGIVESSFVYSMKTSTWSVIASLTPLFSHVDYRACFVNGALHWFVYCDFKESHVEGHFYILTFDLSTHVFGKIELPETSWKLTRLTTIQDSLAVIYTKDENTWIWVRRDASWSVAFESKADILEVFHQTSNNGDLLLRIVWGSFYVYNPKTWAQSKLVNFNAASRMVGIENFVENLQFLEMGSPAS